MEVQLCQDHIENLSVGIPVKLMKSGKLIKRYGKLKTYQMVKLIESYMTLGI